MKKRYIILTTLLATFALLLWWRSHRPTGQLVQQADTVETNEANGSPPPVPKAQGSATADAAVASEPAPGSNFTARLQERRKQMDAALDKAQDQWRTPIEFYGKVVDESNMPVLGVHVDFGCNDLSPEGTSNYHTTSDGSGLFSIAGIAGKLLGVSLSKEGYYTSRGDNSSFYYAGKNVSFIPDAANPIVFHLRKKGVAEPLIRFKKSFRVPKDGSPIQIDLTTGRETSSGSADLKVECWTQDAGKKSGEHFDWKCRVSLVGGGMQPCTEEFPFSAPEVGYASSDAIDMTVKPDQQWQLDVQRGYFIRTSDGRFGRVVFRMVAHGDHFCLIESYFNPSGSRNLEFDPNNVVSGSN